MRLSISKIPVYLLYKLKLFIDIIQTEQRRRRDTDAKPRQIVTVGPVQVRKAQPEKIEAHRISFIPWAIAAMALFSLGGLIIRKVKKNEIEPQEA